MSFILLPSLKLFVFFLFVYSPVSGTSFQKLQVYHYLVLNPKNSYEQTGASSLTQQLAGLQVR